MVVGRRLRDLAPDAFVESEVLFMRHTWRFCDPALGALNPPGSGAAMSLWMVQRSIFDFALAQRAAKAGAEVRDAALVRQIDVNGGIVVVRTSGAGLDEGQTFTADQVIGADGANGVTAKAAGLRKSRTLAIALEVEHPYSWDRQAHPDLRPDVCHLEYGAVPRGYAWVFPKADHLNVGAGVFRPRSAEGRGDASVRPLLQQAICQYMDSLNVPYRRDDLQFFAHPLPLWDGREQLHAYDGRILLAGDAAGLVNPFFGDGILHAIKSGAIAAHAVMDGATGTYTDRIHAEFASNFDASLKLAKFFYRWPRVCYRHGVRREHATRTAARLLAGESLFSEVAGRAVRRLRAVMVTERLSGRRGGPAGESR